MVKILGDREELKGSLPEIREYLYDSFGSYERIDYGMMKNKKIV
jgi:hypothetical protein